MAPASRPSTARSTGARAGSARASRWPVTPVLVKQVRSGVVESVHRGDIVEVDATGRMRHVLGDPDRVVNLRSTVKPFGLLALLRAGGRAEFDLTTEELAVMTSSHSGEDLHVRTIQAVYRRLAIPQSVLACGTEGSPLDPLTAARLARDGERPSPLRHMCSGNHTVLVLLAKLGGWPLETYWQEDHPAHVAFAEAVAAAFAVRPDRLVTGVDGCGILTYAFPLRDVARAFAILADPSALPADDPRVALAPHLLEVRDAMRTYPELVAGTRDRLDTSLMKATEGLVVSKSGMEGLRGMAILPGARGAGSQASGMAVKIEDGDGYERGTWAAGIEALRQAGVVEGQALRMLARYHRPVDIDPHGRTAGESIAEFELAPVGELTG
ncbi:MAG TPA: asparaginase [Candidatus Limnocylindrales bacterium]|nr:asparaginase [Candidatus Limnocylindrales bacterium]